MGMTSSAAHPCRGPGQLPVADPARIARRNSAIRRLLRPGAAAKSCIRDDRDRRALQLRQQPPGLLRQGKDDCIEGQIVEIIGAGKPIAESPSQTDHGRSCDERMARG